MKTRCVSNFTVSALCEIYYKKVVKQICLFSKRRQKVTVNNFMTKHGSNYEST